MKIMIKLSYKQPLCFSLLLKLLLGNFLLNMPIIMLPLSTKSYFRKFLRDSSGLVRDRCGSFWHVRTKKSRNLEKEPYVPSVQGMKYHWQPSMEDFRSGKVMEVFMLFQAQSMYFKFPAPDLLVGLETEPQENWTSVELTYTFPPLLDSFFSSK